MAGEYRLAVFRRVLEFSPEALTRPSVAGLEKFLNLSRAELSNEAALSLLNRLNPAQLRSFLEALNTLDDPLVAALSRAGQLETLAGAPQLAQTLRTDAVISSLILNAARFAPAEATARIQGIVAVARSLPAVPELVARGEFFARGGTSRVYEVAGQPDLLVKQGGGRLRPLSR